MACALPPRAWHGQCVSSSPALSITSAARGNERKSIYRDDRDRQHFLTLLAQVVDRFHVLVHAYVLMDNHYHALAETLEANLARVMRQLDGDYAQHFNRRHRRVGHLFQARYKALLVDRDAYLVELSRYIHLNPVRAGLVGHATEHPWSSAAAYVGAAPIPVFLTVAEVLGHFGRTLLGARSRYREFLHAAEEGRSRVTPLAAVVGQTLLGDPAWVRDMRQRIETWRAAGGTRDWPEAEVPARRQLRLRPTLERVIDAVADGMRADREAIWQVATLATRRAPWRSIWRKLPAACRRRRSQRPLELGTRL